ncbi:TonB-dependent receptor [Arenibacter sp. GZD96]|uniref:SusC/RagA family TonB-linked outer membrane protein n=1 Tax=Aurantibrevibacter litoralis TaxID=3106030 RepID=UPI002AFF94D0|nr:TonB-dependent receptor [Arenibacter sp. GZD-96]MEA1786413.1 TonB-dependent receptor [Arenibacter sp. GZD-96]
MNYQTKQSAKCAFRNYALLMMFLLSGGLFCTSAQGQGITVTGTVTAESDGLPLPGASIVDANDPTKGVITDFDGNYSITLSSGTTSLRFSSIGFKTVLIAVNNRSTVNVVMEDDVANLDEVVVVGYGTQKKATVTGAVTAVKGDVLEIAPAISFSNTLAGRLPGVVIIQTNGEPGNDESTITIRGNNTLGNSSPLIVIDGIPDRDGGIGRLNGRDIENVTVLKDASAAIYGARAANGALIVTTKQGKTGKPTITYDADFGINQPTRVPAMANARQYANIRNELPIYNLPSNEWAAASSAIQSAGFYTSPTPGLGTIDAVFSPDAVSQFGTDPYLFPDTDWFGATFKEWAEQSNHNLSISGGSEDIKYFSSVGYQNQDGIYKNSNTRFQQYNFRINTDIKINDYISTKLGVMFRKEERKLPTEEAGAIFRMLMRGRPTDVAIFPNGLPGPDIENGQNPVVITTNATGFDSRPTDFTQFTGSVDIKNPWVKGLKLTLLAGVDLSNERQKKWETPWTLYSLDRATYLDTGVPVLNSSIRSTFTDARLFEASSNITNTNLTAMLNYDFNLGEDNTFNILAGVTQEKFRGNFFSAFRRNFISTAIDQLFAGGSEQQDTNGSAFNRARLGYYGRAQYNYKEKYLAEFIWRYDGSFIFPEADRFGFFPGFLAGWNVSNEDFFNVKFVDFLKIRGSYGEMGNDQVFFGGELQEFAFLSNFAFNQFPVNNQVVTTLEEAILANPNFTWEKAKNFNIGLDAILFNGKIDLTLEYFLNQREQILIQQTGSTPGSSGIGNLLPPVNAGEVDNEGFEFAINYNGGKDGGLKYDIGFNGGYAQNEVVFMDEIPGAPSYQRQEGKAIGGRLVYLSDGAFLNQAEIDANTIDYSAATATLRPGDMKFKDFNGDGRIDADDQVRLDEGITPTFNFGVTMNLHYKGFDVSVLFQGATGASLPIQTESGDIGNYLAWSANNRWSIDNPSSVHPRLASRGDTFFTGGNFGNNTYFLFSKDYVRLKNLQVAYNFPSKLVEPFGLSNFKVYVSGLNLLTWAKSDIFDPESTNGAGTIYPQSRVINTGFSLTF